MLSPTRLGNIFEWRAKEVLAWSSETPHCYERCRLESWRAAAALVEAYLKLNPVIRLVAEYSIAEARFGERLLALTLSGSSCSAL
jgi:hypothetical protein